MIFDGRKFAKTIEEKVRVSVAQMANQPKIVSILIGNDPASELYTKLKKEDLYSVCQIGPQKIQQEKVARMQYLGGD